MKCLITGINGFLAGYIQQTFECRGYKVYGIYHSAPSRKLDEDRQFHITLPSLEIYEVLKTLKPDVLIHAAGTSSVTKSVDEPYSDFSLSVPATAILLDAIRQYSLNTRFIFLSSAAVYGNPDMLPVKENDKLTPISPYGYHKKMGEELCWEFQSIYGVEAKVVRIFSAYGLGLKKQVVYDLVNKAKKAVTEGHKSIQVYGTGYESRDFLHAKDIAKGILQVSETQSVSSILNLGSGEEITIKQLVSLILSEISAEISVVYTGTIKRGDPVNWCADINNIRSVGFNPEVSLKEGIREIVKQQ